jgi:hypothetical protein
MRRVMQILTILLVIVLVFLLARGLGLTSILKRHKQAKKISTLNDFEYDFYDFDWTTGGYVKIEPSKENKTHGKKCAKTTFLLASQFYPTPTPSPSWRPEMILDTRSITKLTEYEWQDFTSLNLDVYNPKDQPVTYSIQIADARSFIHETSGALDPKKVTNISVSLADLIKERMDLSSIRSLKFRVDTMEATEPIELYLDYLRLEGDSSLPKKK